MADILTEDRAQIIANAVRNDGTFCGSKEWLGDHHIGKDEWDAFLEYPIRLAQMYEWREANLTVGSCEVELTFTKHAGKVGSDDEQWTVFAPQVDTSKILRVAETGTVVAQLFPKQMPMDGENVALVNVSTGEVL